MQSDALGIDPNLRTEFIAETQEALAGIPALLIELERRPDDKEIINAVFRPIHSLKGNAAYFGLLKIKELAHAMESILDKARNGRLFIDRAALEALLGGVDWIVDAMLRVKEGGQESDRENLFETGLTTLRRISTGQSTAMVGALQRLDGLYRRLQALDPALAGEVTAIRTALAEGNALPAAQKPDSHLPAALQTLQSMLSAPLPGLLPSAQSAEVLALFEQLRLQAPQGADAILARAIDYYHTMVESVGFDNLLRELLVEALDELSRIGPWPVPSTRPAQTSGPSPSPAHPAAMQGGNTMRIREESVDQFLSFVGELIVIREMFGALQRRLSQAGVDGEISTEFRRLNDSFSTLSQSLQQGIMAIRKVAVRSVLQKLPRIARDVAVASGKQVDISLLGEDIEIDKSLVEALEAPLVHMVRNAADHGIESVAVRKQKGKPESGRIEISVQELSDSICVCVEDDGAGVDLEGIRRKAERIGMIKTGSALREEDLVNLLFAPGVSTAAKVTDISGRGVGMDVVRQNITAVGGRISIETAAGKGTVIRIHLPRSVGTHIVKAMVVRSGEETYVFPLEDVVESFDAGAGDFSPVAGQGMCVKRRGTLLPFRTLAGVLGISEIANREKERTTVLMLRHNGGMYAIGVDEILGLQQIVLKPVAGLEQQNLIFKGAAITGSGKPAMVIDSAVIVSR